MSASGPTGPTTPTNEERTALREVEPAGQDAARVAAAMAHASTIPGPLGTIRFQLTMALADHDHQGVIVACRAALAFGLECKAVADELEEATR